MNKSIAFAVFVMTLAVFAAVGCDAVLGLKRAELWVVDGGGAGSTCTTPGECPGGSECSTAECVGGACGLAAVQNGTACNGGLGNCQMGTCTCLPANTCPDGCFDLTGNTSHCGTCSETCPVGDVCSGGQCVCPGSTVMCANVCLDTSMDPNNCGGCGHSCQGGACLESACQPVTLASGQTQPSGIAVDTTNVYWTNLGTSPNAMDGAVMVCALGGCGGKPTALASGLDFPSSIAVDTAAAYWTSNAGVMKCTKVGCAAPTTLSSAANAMGPGPIVVDAMDLYWTNSITSVVMKCALNNCSATLAMLASGQTVPTGIAVDALSVYWANDTSDGTVFKVPLAGGTPFTLGIGQTSPVGIAVDGTNAYWTTGDSVMACAIGGCGGSSTTIASGLPAPFRLVVDTANLYWTDSTGAVNKHAITGGTTTTLVSGMGSPYALTQDATTIYWTDIGTNTVMKLAK